MATNTYTALTAEQKTFYDRTLLERLTPNLVFAKYGETKTIPENEGKKINFRRFNSYEAATTPLTEGVTPTGKTISISTVECELSQYGDFTETSDVLDMASIDPVVTEITQVHGEQAADTIDQVVRNVVCAGTNVLYATGSATSAIAATNKMTSELIRKAVRALRRANAKPKEGGFFIGIVHPDVAYDLMNDPLWEDVSKYNGGKAIIKGEIGKLAGVRFVESTNALVKEGKGASGADVYCSMIIGRGAYGIPDIAGSKKTKVIVKSLGSGGTNDPLDQRATIGWKSLFGTVRLDELSMIRVETGATV